jgi:hypothetical protein
MPFGTCAEITAALATAQDETAGLQATYDAASAVESASQAVLDAAEAAHLTSYGAKVTTGNALQANADLIVALQDAFINQNC